MTNKTASTRKPVRRKVIAPIGSEAFASQQLSLFQQFLVNSGDEREILSNAVDLWDNSPRFSVSRTRMNALRTPEGFLEELEIPFQYRGQSFKVVIHPARIKGKEGKWTSYYPSAREELIEHALRKLSTEQQAGYFDKPGFRSGVIFSLYALRKELEQQGHSLRYDEIVEALDILSTSVIDIVATTSDEDATALTRSAYLQGLTMVRRKDYDADPTVKCVAQFHPLVTQSMDCLTYRQFNYQRLMKCRSQVARWLLNQLVLKYTQAGFLNSFEMRYSTIKRDSGLLGGYKIQRQAIAALDDAWGELKELGALSVVKKSELRGSRGKIEDVVYTLNPTHKFITEQKAANRRQNNAKASLAQNCGGLPFKQGE